MASSRKRPTMQPGVMKALRAKVAKLPYDKAQTPETLENRERLASAAKAKGKH